MQATPATSQFVYDPFDSKLAPPARQSAATPVSPLPLRAWGPRRREHGVLLGNECWSSAAHDHPSAGVSSGSVPSLANQRAETGTARFDADTLSQPFKLYLVWRG